MSKFDEIQEDAGQSLMPRYRQNGIGRITTHGSPTKLLSFSIQERSKGQGRYGVIAAAL